MRTLKLCVLTRWDFNICIRSLSQSLLCWLFCCCCCSVCKGSSSGGGRYDLVCYNTKHTNSFLSLFFTLFFLFVSFPFSMHPPQWGAADAEIKVPSGENTELKRSPFQAWSRSVYSRTCYAYWQGFLPCLFLRFQSIHLHFFQNLTQKFSCVGCG